MPVNSVSLTVTAANSCTDTKTSSIQVVTGIENKELSAITVYPNPVSSQGISVEIANDNLQSSSVTLTNSLGQIIYTQDISTSETHSQILIPSTSLPDGLYILRLNIGNKTAVRKVVKVQ
jgi:hypothetical protein